MFCNVQKPAFYIYSRTLHNKIWLRHNLPTRAGRYVLKHYIVILSDVFTVAICITIYMKIRPQNMQNGAI